MIIYITEGYEAAKNNQYPVNPYSGKQNRNKRRDFDIGVQAYKTEQTQNKHQKNMELVKEIMSMPEEERWLWVIENIQLKEDF